MSFTAQFVGGIRDGEEQELVRKRTIFNIQNIEGKEGGEIKEETYKLVELKDGGEKGIYKPISDV